MPDEKTFPHKLYNDAQLQPLAEKTEETEAQVAEISEEEKPTEPQEEILEHR